jgi:ABC-2 type transport system ATP-binding protein
MLVCSSVSRAFGRGDRRILAVDGISFEATPGEVVGVVGPNGAGKSTLLRILAARMPLTAGSATLGGRLIDSRGVRRLVGYAADPPQIPRELTAIEWLSYLASHRAARPSERLAMVRRAAELGALGGFASRRVETYSHGLAQRLATAAALLCGESLVLLDEVLAGLDPGAVKELGEGIIGAANSGRVVVLASHNLGTIERLATRVLVMRSGRLVGDATMATFLRERVAELTLSGRSMAVADGLVRMFPGAVRTGGGIDVPLDGGLTMEHLMATCRAERVAVAGSRIRYRRVEDLLAAG